MTNAQTIEGLRIEVLEAKEREEALALEATELPGRISAAAREDVRAKAQQARETGNVSMATLASDLPALEDRKATISYELWASKLYRAEVQKDLHAAEEQAAYAEIPAVQASLDRAVAEVQKAEEAKKKSAYDLRVAERKQDNARRYRRAAEAEIGALEAEFPDA